VVVRTVAVLSGLVLLWALVPPAMAADGLAPHRAFYRLASPPGRTGPEGPVRGGLLLAWERTCTGWTSRQRLIFGPADRSGPAVDVRFEGEESANGRRFDFHFESFEGGRSRERIEGTAELRPPVGGIARFSSPPGLVLGLPPDTVFPVGQLQDVLAAFAGAPRLVHHRIFDGSAPEPPALLTTFVGRPVRTEAGMLWPLAMAWFDPRDPAMTPLFELAARIDAQGVFREIRLDFGALVLEGRAVRVERLAAPSCRP